MTDVFRELKEMSDEGILWGNLAISAWIYVVGMVISIAIAIPLGLLIGGVRILDRILSTYVWALYTTPRLILMPLILLWVGINDTARIVIIVLSAVPATLVVVMEGVKTVDTSLVRAAKSFGASRVRLFRSVVLPSTVPFIATGIRMGVSRGLIGLFIGEIFTGAERHRLHHHAGRQDLQQRADVRHVADLRALLRRVGRSEPAARTQGLRMAGIARPARWFRHVQQFSRRQGRRGTG